MKTQVKKPTPLQQEWAKQAKRIRAIYLKGEKQGYVFTDKVAQEMPKRVTKQAVASLKSLTPNKLYLDSYKDTSVGRVPGAVAKRSTETFKRSKAAKASFASKKAQSETKMPKASNIAYEKLYEAASEAVYSVGSFRAQGASVILDWLQAMKDKYGEEKAGEIITEAMQKGMEWPGAYFYGSKGSEANAWVERVMARIPEITEEDKKEISIKMYNEQKQDEIDDERYGEYYDE